MLSVELIRFALLLRILKKKIILTNLSRNKVFISENVYKVCPKKLSGNNSRYTSWISSEIVTDAEILPKPEGTEFKFQTKTWIFKVCLNSQFRDCNIKLNHDYSIMKPMTFCSSSFWWNWKIKESYKVVDNFLESWFFCAQDFNGSSSRSQMDPSLIRSYSINSASSTLNSQTIIQQRLSQPVLPMNNRTPSPASPGSESVAAVYIGGGSSSTDIWVPRENVTPTIMSKSQSSSTDTLEATDSPGQNRRHDSNIGACGSLSSSTDTLDENCHSLKGSLEPNSPNGKLSPQHQVVDKSPVIGVNGSKMNYPTVRHSESKFTIHFS